MLEEPGPAEEGKKKRKRLARLVSSESKSDSESPLRRKSARPAQSPPRAQPEVPTRFEANDTLVAAAGASASAIQGEELGVEGAPEQHEATVDDEGLSPIGEENHVPIERPEVILPDNMDEDMGNEGLNASQEEGPDERSEQVMAISPDVLDGGVGDEGLRIAQGEEAGIDGRLEQPEAGAPSEVIAALFPGLIPRPCPLCLSLDPLSTSTGTLSLSSSGLLSRLGTLNSNISGLMGPSNLLRALSPCSLHPSNTSRDPSLSLEVLIFKELLIISLIPLSLGTSYGRSHPPR
ncbi:hypothetical protein AMTR_s00060p00193990 [Amborella trichopoda]|uniref:Uncharacterized protein n=1 Tax=Amborella trichopoda TaxID=13333 RepID=W1NK90_AMBTC|nr:hypothetical protein AMTR_s00060p00193990 [Amborella trichopoda]